MAVRKAVALNEMLIHALGVATQCHLLLDPGATAASVAGKQVDASMQTRAEPGVRNDSDHGRLYLAESFARVYRPHTVLEHHASPQW